MNASQTQELAAIARRLASLEPQARDTVLRKMIERGIAPERLPIVPYRHEQKGVLSHAQVRQWFLWQLNPQSSAYHISGALKLTGELHEAALRGAFDALVQRHEALRTVFRADGDGLARPVVLERGELAWSMIDVCDVLDISVREQRTAAQVAFIVQSPFDLTRGPLLRAGLIRLSAREHVLVVVMHHIVSDGWSMQIIVDEFAAHYAAAVQGGEPSLAALPIQYSDYAVWQRQWLEAGEKARQLAYWTAQLGTEQPTLQLPADHPRRTDGSYHAARYSFELDAALVGALGRSARSHGATPFMLLLAAWQALLYRYTGQSDIRVGVPIANRHRVETENVVGLFVNTQVLRNVIEPRMSLRQLIAQARAAALGAQAHQDLPFEQLVEALQPDRSRTHNPLFQVMFNHQRDDYRVLERLPGLQVEDCDVGERVAQFELTITVVEQAEGGISIALTYAKELFELQTIERLGHHCVAMLAALTSQPEQPVGDVVLMSDAELKRLMHWDTNPQRYADETPVHQLIERQVRRSPHAPALVFGEVSLSYAELNARANRLAHHLRRHGVGPEVRLGLALERSIEMVVGLLAVLKAGGAYVPLDPESPEERLTYMLRDSGITLLLTQSDLGIEIGLPTLELDTLDLSSEPEHDPEVALHGENLAYVIYTSGSTGRPKGAANRHRSLHNRLVWMQQAYALDSTDTVLQKTPFGFDVSVWEFFWPLMVGARLAIAPPGAHRDPARLIELIRQHEATTLHFVPSMLQAFIGQAGVGASTGLKRIVCSGEALPAALQNQVFDRLPKAQLYNLYGPTEAAIDVTHWTCRADGLGHVAIGRPIAHTRTHVLDAELNRVPQGVAGELYLGGIGLARGYLDRPGLTAERFVADPLDELGGRLYRTGDLVRWRADGQLEYLGRLDHQLKIRGLRIELGEIEAQLLEQPAIQQAVVVAKDQRLIAYIATETELDTTELKVQLARHLPEYMVPATIVRLKTLPLNANGKVDRKALPEPNFSERAYEPPEGEVEEQLAAIWAEVLGLPRIGRHDNFFEIGGHSLAALRVVAACDKHFGEGLLTVGEAIQQPVLHAQARLIASPNPCTIEFASRNSATLGVPLFCFPGLHVHSFAYGDIVDVIGADRPVHSFGCYTLTRARWKLWRFEELAAMYAEQVVNIGSGAPVALLGWSSGGDLAFEVAKQLHGRVEVLFVGMLDVCHPVGAHTSTAGREPEAAHFEAAMADWLDRSKMSEPWRRLFARVEIAEKALVLDYVSQKWPSLPLDGPALGSEEFAAWAGIAHSVMMRRYRWPASEVPVYAWHADDTLARKPDEVRDWHRISRVEFQSVITNADHQSLLTNRHFLGELRHCLRAAERFGCAEPVVSTTR